MFFMCSLLISYFWLTLITCFVNFLDVALRNLALENPKVFDWCIVFIWVDYLSGFKLHVVVELRVVGILISWQEGGNSGMLGLLHDLMILPLVFRKPFILHLHYFFNFVGACRQINLFPCTKYHWWCLQWPSYFFDSFFKPLENLRGAMAIHNLYLFLSWAVGIF